MEGYICPKKETPGKIIGGIFPKDSGKYSSRIGQVVKQALKVPGPGIYTINEVSNGRKFVFAKGSREVKIHQGKRPDPGTYEQDQKYVLPRTLHGVCSKGPKITYVDLAARKSNIYPGPPKYNPQEIKGHIQSRAMSVPSNASKVDISSRRDFPGPGKYNPGHTITEERVLNSAFGPKYKAFSEMGSKSGSTVPGPNSYKLISLEKISRGTKLMQTYNYGKGAMTGYF